MTLPKCIVRAAPYCTLWVKEWKAEVFRFRFWPSLVITAQTYVEMAG